MTDQKRMAMYAIAGLGALYFGPKLYRRYFITTPHAMSGTINANTRGHSSDRDKDSTGKPANTGTAGGK